VAEPLLRRALAISEGALGADHPDSTKAREQLEALLHARGDSLAGSEGVSTNSEGVSIDKGT